MLDVVANNSRLIRLADRSINLYLAGLARASRTAASLSLRMPLLDGSPKGKHGWRYCKMYGWAVLNSNEFIIEPLNAAFVIRSVTA